MNDLATQELSDKIAAGEERNAQKHEARLIDQIGEKAIEAKDKVTDFAKAHPVATVAGGLAIGVIISGFFKNSPTRKAGRKAAGMAAIGSELAFAYMQSAMKSAEEAGRAGVEKLDDFGDTLGDTARSLRRDANHTAAGLSDNARIVRRSVGKTISRAIRRR